MVADDKDSGLVGTAFSLLRSEDAKTLLSSLTSVLALEGSAGVKRVVAALIDDAKSLNDREAEEGVHDEQMAR